MKAEKFCGDASVVTVICLRNEIEGSLRRAREVDKA